MGNYLANPLIFLLSTLFELYAGAVLLRFLLQWVRADFYNPLSQFILKITNPLLRPLRKVVPGFAGQDMAALVLVYALNVLKLLILYALLGAVPGIMPLLWIGFIESLLLLLNLYLMTIFIEVILSWVASGYNPIAAVIVKVNQPLMRPVRRLLPDMGGIDLSPLFVLLALQVCKMLVGPLAMVVR